MKVAVMQPYLFPYIGYFQLINYCDLFVLYDDANFIKQGYINRNNLLINGEVRRFTIPVPGASSFKKIKHLTFAKDVRKSVKMIKQSYAKAPYFSEAFPLIENVLSAEDRSITSVCEAAIRSLFEYIDKDIEVIRSSSLEYDQSQTTEAKIIQICKATGATTYINPIGGKALYDCEYFKGHGISLKFIQSLMPRYQQQTKEFVPNLSIIDAMMNASKQKIKCMLESYEIS